MTGMAKKKTGKAAKGGDRHLSGAMIRLPEDVHRQLKKLAERNNRPATWELRALVIKALEEAKLWPPEDAPT